MNGIKFVCKNCNTPLIITGNGTFTKTELNPRGFGTITKTRKKLKATCPDCGLCDEDYFSFKNK